MNLSRRHFLHFLPALASALAFTAQGQPQTGSRAIRNRHDWQAAREQTLAGLQAVMGPLPPRPQTPPTVTELVREELPAFTRIKLKYLSEGDDYVPAYLLLPKPRARRGAAVLCLHQTTKIGKGEPAGLGGNSNLHYAKELAERGYVTLAPDYPYLGENNFDPYQHGYVSCSMKGIFNHMRAVDLLQSLPEVDGKRIGCVGHSLGGHNTLFLAAFDQRIKALATSCGFTSFAKYYQGDLTGWSGVRYMPRIAEKYGKSPARMPFDFPSILVALAPRPLFINAPLHDNNFEVSGVQDCVATAKPVYERVFRLPDALVANYPDAGHDFPLAIRQQAWAFFDRWL